MAFTSKDVLSGIIAAGAGVVAFIAIEKIIGSFLANWSFVILIIGVALIFLAKRIQSSIGIDSSTVKLIASILLFLGFRPFIAQYINIGTAYYALGISLVIIIFKDNISSFILSLG